jgi:hypothetical protein
VKRISKKVREEAILAIDVASSSGLEWWPNTGADEIAPLYSAADRLITKALLAFDAAVPDEGHDLTRWLEAAALLRDGWNPGDPVEVRS